MMLIDEFANTRMWAAEAERQQREREQVRRVRERAGWLRSAALRGRDVVAETARNVDAPARTDAEETAPQGASAPQEASTSQEATAPQEAATPQEAAAQQERELAHAGR